MMRVHRYFLLLLLACGQAWSQNPLNDKANLPDAAQLSPSTGARSAVLRQHILIEDSAVRIEEQRRGGETQSISVQPKGSLPAYQVEPKTGERSWKVLGF